MCIRRLIVTLLSFWLIFDTGPSQAADVRALPDLAAITPGREAIAAAASTVSHFGCTTAACIAVVRLNHIFDIIDDSEMEMMGSARYFNSNELQVESKYLHRVLLDHPSRLPPMCALLTSLASRYGAPGAGQGVEADRTLGIELVDLASLMDGNGPPLCLPAVLAALPQTLAANLVIGDERDLCQYSQIFHEPCSRISR